MIKGNVMCSLPKPNRHYHIIRALAANGMTTPILGEQGFLLSNGEYANRVQAKQIAKQAGQLLKRAYKGAKLFSECVW